MSYYEYHVARRYVQFEGALRELPNYAALTGRRILFLTACGPVRDEVEAGIREGLSLPAAACRNPRLSAESIRYARYDGMTERLDALRRKMSFRFHDLGETVVSEENIRRMAALIRQWKCDTVVGIGGGRGMDFARALTRFLPLKVILVPTLAATNASISTLSVLYSPDGSRIDSYWRMDNAPELVLADTELLIKNGERTLAAGIGDIVSTYYEGLCNLKMSGVSRQGGALLGRKGLEAAIEIMRSVAPAALEAMRQQKINPAFENVVSLILHNPGPMGMICTTGYAHILDEMLLYFRNAHQVPHGLRVGFATLPMLLFQRETERKIGKYLDFCRVCGIPTSLKELGLAQVTREQWSEAFDMTTGKSGTCRTLPFVADKDAMIASLLDSVRFEDRQS